MHALADEHGKKAYQQVMSSAFRADFESSDEDEENQGTENEEDKEDEEDEEDEENQDTGNEEDEGERAQKRRRIDERIPRFSRETLEEMTVQNLKKRCIQWNIKGGKNKAAYVENISHRSQTIHEKSSSVDKVYCSITSSAPPDPAPAHQVYRKWFNLVDKANKKWYAVEEHHGHQDWRAMMILSVLKFGMWNAWVYCSRVVYAKWIAWRKATARLVMFRHVKK